MKLKIQIGEPRGFDAGDGTNRFTATVVEGMSGSREVDALPKAADLLTGSKTVDRLVEYWFVAYTSPIQYEGSSFSSLLFVPRYKTKQAPLEMLAEGERLVFNAVWRQDGQPWDAQSVKAAQEAGIEIGGMLVANAEMEKE